MLFVGSSSGGPGVTSWKGNLVPCFLLGFGLLVVRAGGSGNERSMVFSLERGGSISSSSKMSSKPPLMNPESNGGIGRVGRVGLDAGGLDRRYADGRGTGGDELRSPVLSSGEYPWSGDCAFERAGDLASVGGFWAIGGVLAID
jgi:hypothetical protein